MPAPWSLGDAAFKDGDWPRARRALTRALVLNPNVEGAAEARKALFDMGATSKP